jgi:hypothetical protein
MNSPAPSFSHRVFMRCVLFDRKLPISAQHEGSALSSLATALPAGITFRPIAWSCFQRKDFLERCQVSACPSVSLRW